MNAARAAAVLKGQTALAQKVYNAVPIGEPWTAQEIEKELVRTGHPIGIHVIRGCLGALYESGLVRQPDNSRFIRTRVRDKQQKAEVITMPSTNVAPIVTPKESEVTPADRLLALTDRFKSLVDEFGRMSAELEDIAIAVTEQLSESDADTAKLRQLQQILKSIA